MKNDPLFFILTEIIGNKMITDDSWRRKKTKNCNLFIYIFHELSCKITHEHVRRFDDGLKRGKIARKQTLKSNSFHFEILYKNVTNDTVTTP